jgi:(E)-4-hydroxy-3-methylbut-2-enyl-diphosphate synthase
LNPGNIGSIENVKKVVDYAKEYQVPIRIGVNSGSIAKHILKKHGVSAEGIVESAMEHVRILEELNFDMIKISVKASSVPLTIESYKLLATRCDYPFHVGVTESGTETSGTIKSSIGIGALLALGIGDTIRVSLTAEPEKEIRVAKGILKSLGLRPGLDIISCPTCGRTNIPLIELAQEVECRLKPFEEHDIVVAVMGCEVNGPGEAAHADYGIAGGNDEGLIFIKGQIVKKVPAVDLVDELIKRISG